MHLVLLDINTLIYLFSGVLGVKQHKFFESIDWDNLLRVKSEFVPELQGEEDTSYFDSE